MLSREEIKIFETWQFFDKHGRLPFEKGIEKQDKLIYPSLDKVVIYNILTLGLIKTKKADKPEVLSYEKLLDIIEECKDLKGDVYDKAVFLLKGLTQSHAFASANKRTAFIVAKEFLVDNNVKLNVGDDPKQARAMIGIRENYYKDSEIREWLKNGKIREFKR